MKQMLISRSKKLYLITMIAFFAICIPGCKCGGGGGTVQVKPHQNMPGDTYCVYKITKVIGEGALKVDDIVCLYCPPPATSRCASTKTIEVAPGMEYELVNQDNTCTDCPSANTYE